MTPTLLRVREKVIASVPGLDDCRKDNCVLKNCWITSHRPIQLADVLRAISFVGKWEIDGLTGSGILIACTAMGDFVDGYSNSLEATWDLTKSLDEQSPETIAFLDSILNTMV